MAFKFFFALAVIVVGSILIRKKIVPDADKRSPTFGAGVGFVSYIVLAIIAFLIIKF